MSLPDWDTVAKAMCAVPVHMLCHPHPKGALLSLQNSQRKCSLLTGLRRGCPQMMSAKVE